MSRTNEQGGQVLVVAGLVAFVVCGIIAFAIDYGVLTNQHRNIQAFVDDAVIAAAQQLNPSNQTFISTQQANARKTAFIYLRDNLAKGSGNVPIALTSLSGCWGSSLLTQFQSDIKSCALPAPYDHFIVTICAPGEDSASGNPCSSTLTADTVSMRVSETVATSFANLLGFSQVSAGGFATAQLSADANNSSGSGTSGSGGTGGAGASGGSNSAAAGTNLIKTNRYPFGLWSDGCINIHNLIEIFAADVYVNRCSLVTGNPLGGAVCVESTPASGGNFIFGPNAVIPTNPVPSVNQNLANCTGATNGAIFSMGQVSQDTTGNYSTAPSYAPPPNYGAATSPWPGDAAPTNACVNGTRSSTGLSIPAGCYNPGTYARLTDIKNNLNPGVYNIVGPPPGTLGCEGTAAGCASVIFTGSTMNANWADVGDRCWASPNNPTLGAFNWPCPDGYVMDPQSTTITDPMCKGYTTTQLGAPNFSVASSLLPGFLLPATQYFVRVSQTNVMGESASTELPITLVAGTAIDVTILGPAPLGVTGYNIYISKAASIGQAGGFNEILAGSAAALGVTTLTTFPATNALPYPLFDTTACRGFRNIPSRPPAYPQPQTSNVNALENYGVTFNLYNSASMCFALACSPSGTDNATVFLSPFCSSLSSDKNPTPVPPVHYGTSCFPARKQYEADPSRGPVYTGGAFLNDGGFVVYSAAGAGNAGNGRIFANDNTMHIGMTGTLYAPAGRLVLNNSPTFNLVGQAFLSNLDLGTASTTLAPLIYFPCCALATQTGNTSPSGGLIPPQPGGNGTGVNGSGGIIGAQQAVVVRLIR